MIILFLLAEPSLSACQEISSIDEDDIEEDGDGDDDDWHIMYFRLGSYFT